MRSAIDGDFLTAGTRDANHDGVFAFVLGKHQVAVIGFAGK